MLKQRIITGLTLAVVAIVGVSFFPSGWVALFFALVLAMAAWEWSLLVSQKSLLLRGLYVAMVLLVFLLVWLLKFTLFSKGILLLAWFLWASIFFALWHYRPRQEGVAPRHQTILGLLGPVILGAALLSVFGLHQQSPAWLLYVLALTAFADIGAYFAGKSFGRRKLSPHLSPGKTQEGALGGVAAAFLLAIITALFFSLSLGQAIAFIFLSVAMSIVSVTGDLFFSMLKRESGVKDSGNILPGHGGVLDRLDSHIAVLPLFYVGLSWIL